MMGGVVFKADCQTELTGLFAVLAEARNLGTRTDEHMWEAELRRMEGELRWMPECQVIRIAGWDQSRPVVAFVLAITGPAEPGCLHTRRVR
ncbi:hypothetical protein NOV72_01890 [Caballeronia novacaledonica]|uniref:Uncharacterized protein n=1 Tax=Caballeronia novacaledonica TaxID=1544861 RepID=A0A2U3I3G2_9BURK|nr:hypothetical protein NOV72_01890 [Caballeronia novacaledonica]